MTSASPLTLGDRFGSSRAQFGERTAVIDADRAFTYADLDAWSATLANRLQDVGVTRGSRVAVFLPNSVEWIVSALAIARSGAIILPINVRSRPDELRNLLLSAAPRAVVLTESFLTNPCADRLEDAVPALSTLPRDPQLPATFMVGPPRPWAEPFPQVEPLHLCPLSPSSEQAVRENDPLVVFWTSGTTGEPKGVLHTHSALRNVWNWTSLIGYAPSEVVLTVRPFYYIAGAFWSLFGPLLHGATIVIAQRFTPDELLTLMPRHCVTVLLGGPSLYESLLEHPLLPEVRSRLHLRRGSFGGGAPASGFVRRAREQLGIPLLAQVYGMTELQGFASSTRPGDSDEAVEHTVGQPLPGFEFQLRDETGRDVAQGTPGELFVRGNTLAGYFSHGAVKPGTDGEGWFATGDMLVRRSDANFAFHSRVRDVAKVRGENVALVEVDAVLSALPGVARAVTFAVPDAREGSIIHAVVAPAADALLSEEALRDDCRARLSPHKVPRSFVLVDSTFAWPTTMTGKLQRERIRQLIEGW